MPPHPPAQGHTPGPWKVRRRMFASNFDKTPRFAVETDDAVICETRPIKADEHAELGYDEAQTHANAQLIASAPSLSARLAKLEEEKLQLIADKRSMLKDICRLSDELKQAEGAAKFGAQDVPDILRKQAKLEEENGKLRAGLGLMLNEHPSGRLNESQLHEMVNNAFAPEIRESAQLVLDCRTLLTPSRADQEEGGSK